MNYILDVILCGGVVAMELFGAFVILILVQLISYRVFGFNLYKWLNYNLITRWL